MPLTNKRMLGEMINMGLDTQSLIYHSLHFLSEVYCLLESDAIQQLPRDVPNCYGNSGLTHSLKKEKLSLIAPAIEQAVSADAQFFTIDRKRAGAVAASILTARTASHTPVNKRTDLRETDVCSR